MKRKKVFYSLIVLILISISLKVGYNLGTEKGYQKGYNIGKEIGYSQGHSKGYNNGYLVGYDGLAQQLKEDLIEWWCNPSDLIVDNGYTGTEWLIIELFEQDKGC